MLNAIYHRVFGERVFVTRATKAATTTKCCRCELKRVQRREVSSYRSCPGRQQRLEKQPQKGVNKKSKKRWKQFFSRLV